MKLPNFPIFVVQPKLVRLLSSVAPIDIEAITLGFLVLSRRPLNQEVERHERIHFQQYVELCFVFFPAVYLFDFLWLYLRYRDAKQAYMGIRMEREAYEYMKVEGYCQHRQKYAWFWQYRL